MDLAKDCLDVGLYTDHYGAMAAFYTDRVGLAYEELLKVGGGVHQHRLSLNGAVLKLNSSREPLEDAPTNFAGIDIGTGTDTAEDVKDPDGNRVRLVPGRGVLIHWASSDPERLGGLLAEGFGADVTGPGRLRIGTTELDLHEGGVPVGATRARGFRYITVQVRDVRAEHARLLRVGWREATPPVRLGDTAYISFVADPDGARVEVSQRASLTGPLPDV